MKQVEKCLCEDGRKRRLTTRVPVPKELRPHVNKNELVKALGDQLKAQREALKSILARGRVERIVPALRGFLQLLGTGAALSEEDERRVALPFARSIADSLDQRIARHEGQSVAFVAPDQAIEELKASLQAGAPAVSVKSLPTAMPVSTACTKTGAATSKTAASPPARR